MATEQLGATATAAPQAMPDLEALGARLRERVLAVQPAAFREVPLEGYLAALARWPASYAIQTPPDAVPAMVERLAVLGGPALVGAYHRLVLAELVRAATPERLHGSPIARRTPALFAGLLGEIAAGLEATPDEELSWGRDRFRKDMNVAALRVFASGPRIYELRSGLSRGMILRGGVAQLPRAARLILSMGGHTPLYEGHLYHRLMHRFGPEGILESWRDAAAMLRDDAPAVRGVFGVSWYHDPALARLSPHLDYVRAEPLAHGATLLEVPIATSMVGSALAKSRTRRAAYERGEYRPRSFMLVWPRRALLRWADRQA